MLRKTMAAGIAAASLALVPVAMPLTSAVGYGYGNSAAAAPVKTVSIKEASQRYKFTPKSITVTQGTKVTWSNKTDVEHNVTVTQGLKVNKDIEDGKSVSVTFTHAGTFQYHCEYHPYMKGKIVVK